MCRYLLFWFTFNRTGKQVGRIEPKARPNDSLRRNPSVAAPRSIISSSPATCWRGTGPRPNHPGKSRHQTRNPEIPRGCNCTPEVRCCGSPRIDTRVGLPFPLLSKPRTITSLATRSPGGPTVEAQERQQMSGPLDDQLGFAPDYDAPVPYMQRTRDYYTAIGYTTPYRSAHYADAPFQPLKKPLAQSRVTIITTAAPYDPAKADHGPGAAYTGGAKFYKVYDGDTGKPHDLRISHIGYDRKHTSATDSGTWFPLPQLLKAAAGRRIGEVAPRFFGAPTNRSHRVTIDVDAPEILARCL